jgi:hypothetical protein
MRPSLKGMIDFAFENGENRMSSFDIDEVLCVETTQVPDLAFFQLRVDDAGRADGPSASAVEGDGCVR